MLLPYARPRLPLPGSRVGYDEDADVDVDVDVVVKDVVVALELGGGLEMVEELGGLVEPMVGCELENRLKERLKVVERMEMTELKVALEEELGKGLEKVGCVDVADRAEGVELGGCERLGDFAAELVGTFEVGIADIDDDRDGILKGFSDGVLELGTELLPLDEDNRG